MVHIRLLESGHTVCCLHLIYFYLVIYYGDPVHGIERLVWWVISSLSQMVVLTRRRSAGVSYHIYYMPNILSFPRSFINSPAGFHIVWGNTNGTKAQQLLSIFFRSRLWALYKGQSQYCTLSWWLTQILNSFYLYRIWHCEWNKLLLCILKVTFLLLWT